MTLTDMQIAEVFADLAVLHQTLCERFPAIPGDLRFYAPEQQPRLIWRRDAGFSFDGAVDPAFHVRSIEHHLPDLVKSITAYGTEQETAHRSVREVIAAALHALKPTPRTKQDAIDNPQPRDRWASVDGDVYRVIAVDGDVLAAAWEDSDGDLEENFMILALDALHADFHAETYLGVSESLLGTAP